MAYAIYADNLSITFEIPSAICKKVRNVQKHQSIKPIIGVR